MSKKEALANRFSMRLIALITKLFHPKSIKNMFIKSFFALLVLFIILFLVSGFYFTNIMRNQVYSSMKDTLSLYNKQIHQDFTEALTYLSENSVQNADFTSLGIATTAEEIYLHTIRIQKILSVGNYSFANIGGLFVYSQTQDIFIRQINAVHNVGQSNLRCAESINALLREHQLNGTMDQLDLKQWFLLQVDDEYFIVRIINKRNIYSGIWVNLDQLASSFTQFEDMGANMLFVDSAGVSLTNRDFQNIRLDLNGSLDNPSYYRVDLFHNYLIVPDLMQNSSYSIVALIPTSYITNQLAGLYGFLLFILVWLIVFSFIIAYMMIKFFNTPLEILQPVITSMRSGEFGTEIKTDNQFQEIRIIIAAFNDMISEIQNLRIHLYEDQLTNKEMELQYFKTQVAPHFLINCLNTIFVMSQDHENLDITHQTISTLSDHLRYSLASHTSASLSEEIYYVTNYLILTQLRFPNILTYSIRVDAEAENARVFPHLLLMFTENSIKANLIMDEKFHIQIRGYVYQRENESRVHLTHIDSGTGFKDDSLTFYNHIMNHPEITKKGYGIGIYNTVMRMQLTMGDSAKILFSNEPGQGARIDIDFPYMPFE